MQAKVARTQRDPSGTMLEQPLGDQLKSYFDALTAGPAPDPLMRLTEALEQAFERGELCRGMRRDPVKTR